MRPNTGNTLSRQQINVIKFWSWLYTYILKNQARPEPKSRIRIPNRAKTER
jgi:hypothetical protein